MSATEDLSSAERYDLATKLITQSPPGQVNDVIAGEVPRVRFTWLGAVSLI